MCKPKARLRSACWRAHLIPGDVGVGTGRGQLKFPLVKGSTLLFTIAIISVETS